VIDSAVTAMILAYLQKLIAIPSAYPPGNTSRIAEYLAEELAAMGYTPVIEGCVPGFDNVIASLGSGSPELVFNVHVDTVDPGDTGLWMHPPYKATVEAGRVYGLGAANCKGSAAAQLCLAAEIVRRGGPAQGRVTFTFVCDEESLGPNGMRHLRKQDMIRPDMLLLGAPTDNTLIVAERGVLWVEIRTSGRPAHAGQPQDGDNAISRMVRVLSHLETELSGRLADRSADGMRSTFNTGRVNGGRNTNVVPSECVAQLDRRLLPSETVEQALEEIVAIVESTGEPEDTVFVRLLRGTNGFDAGKDGELVACLSQSIENVTGAAASFSTAIGVSDGRYFADDGIEIVNFGPGTGSQGHAVNESVSISSLHESGKILDDAFQNLIGYAD
jgi:acetylornithine deacetylase/succinyl-diaminopimelate desuccinylase family protein